MYHCINHPPFDMPIRWCYFFKKWITAKFRSNSYRLEWWALELRKWADKIDQDN